MSEISDAVVTQDEFEAFAMDHSRHTHCTACGGCILNPIRIVQISSPVWCMACRVTIENTCKLQGREPPWADIKHAWKSENVGNAFIKESKP